MRSKRPEIEVETLDFEVEKARKRGRKGAKNGVFREPEKRFRNRIERIWVRVADHLPARRLNFRPNACSSNRKASLRGHASSDLIQRGLTRGIVYARGFGWVRVFARGMGCRTFDAGGWVRLAIAAGRSFSGWG
jgi:hypothetical protein